MLISIAAARARHYALTLVIIVSVLLAACGGSAAPGATPQTGFRALLDTMQSLMSVPWNLMLVTARNEFSEGSVIEPSLEFGTSYLEQVRLFALGQ